MQQVCVTEAALVDLPSSASATYFWASDHSADRTATPTLTVPLRAGRRSAVLDAGSVSFSHAETRTVVYRSARPAR